jgi:hypothetical protein
LKQICGGNENEKEQKQICGGNGNEKSKSRFPAGMTTKEAEADSLRE